MQLPKITYTPKSLFISAIACLGLGMLAGVFYYVATMQTDGTSVMITSLPEPPAKPALAFDQSSDLPEVFSMLLIGYGGPGHDGGGLADVNIVVSINASTNVIKLITIPRDTWVKLPGGQHAKLNAAFTKDSPPDFETTKEVVSQITGLPIHAAAAIDFVGYQRLVGGPLEGITVNVSQTLDDPWYPIKGEELNPCGHTPEEIADMTATLSGFELEKQFACRYEHIHFDPGPVVMHGHEALAYVRSRHSSSDFDRSRRQEEVLTAIKTQLFSFDILNQLPKYYEALTQHVTTDLTFENVSQLAPLLALLEDNTFTTINLSTENVLSSSKSQAGAFILIPKAGIDNWQAIQDFIASQ